MRAYYLALLIFLTNCHGRSPTSPDYYEDASLDVLDTSEKDELEIEATQDGHMDASDGVVEPAICPEGWACNDLLDDLGLCHGLCIPQEQELTCPMPPTLGLCQLVPQGGYINAPLSCDRTLVEPVDYPEFVRAHSQAHVAIKVTNRSYFNLALPFSYKSPPDIWQILDSNFQDLTEITLGPKESKILEATMVPQEATLFEGGGPMLTVALSDSCEFNVFTTVLFDEDQGSQCGDFFFPPSYCIGDCGTIGQFYSGGKCCNGCFFPGANCCSDKDCIGGACFDGRCVFETPDWPLGNSLPAGNIHALVVVMDNPDVAPGADVCENRVSELDFADRLQKVEEFYDRIEIARTGKKTVSWKWTVLAGISSEDFITNQDDYLYSRFIDRTEEYLIAKGCKPFAEYDKVLVVSPRAQMPGAAGEALDRGRVVALSFEPFLFAHELGHTFGASDLYLDLGGHYQWVLALMGNNLGGFGYPKDTVMWGEIGFGDHDRNKVIDVFEFEWFPEAIEVTSLEAVLTKKGTLEIRFEFRSNKRKLFLPDFAMRLPDFNVSRDMHLGAQKKVVVFDENEVPLDSIRQQGTVKVEISAELRYTDKAWQRKVLSLDKTFEAEVKEE